MKLASLKVGDAVQVVGVEESDGGTVRYLDLHRADAVLPRDLKELLGSPELLARVERALETAKRDGFEAVGELVAPIPQPGKIFCIGLNYRDHAIETGATIPSEPVVFGKFGNAIAGPDAEIPLPEASSQVDFEAELVAVIGKEGKNLQPDVALSHIAGYMCGNDVSARDWQKGRPGGQWLLGKTPDRFAPTGPYLVTADEVGDPHALDIELWLNGERMQGSNTREFIFTLPEILAHISRLITLEPGDLIFTGTPSGVGMARSPQRFLKPGDATEVRIAGLGRLTNRFTAERA